jgi:hypothetical protein
MCQGIAAKWGEIMHTCCAAADLLDIILLKENSVAAYIFS